MADTGWQFPGTVASYKGITNNDWTTPDNVKANDGSNASWTGPKFDGNDPETGPELRTTNYGFSIPTSAIITGVELKIEGYSDPNRPGEVAYLTESGSPALLGTQKTDDWTDMPTQSGSPLGAGTHIYGSSTDLWGASLTPTIVNSSNFGWHFMIYDSLAPLQMNVDYMQMRVHYNLAATPPIIMMIGA